MLKLVVVPYWLAQLLARNKIDKESIVDTSEITRILSLNDIINYKRVNYRQNILQLTHDPFYLRHILNALVIDTTTIFDSDQIPELPNTPSSDNYLCTNDQHYYNLLIKGNASVSLDTDLSTYCLTPCALCEDTIGLVITAADTPGLTLKTLFEQTFRALFELVPVYTIHQMDILDHYIKETIPQIELY